MRSLVLGPINPNPSLHHPHSFFVWLCPHFRARLTNLQQPIIEAPFPLGERQGKSNVLAAYAVRFRSDQGRVELILKLSSNYKSCYACTWPYAKHHSPEDQSMLRALDKTATRYNSSAFMYISPSSDKQGAPCLPNVPSYITYLVFASNVPPTF